MNGHFFQHIFYRKPKNPEKIHIRKFLTVLTKKSENYSKNGYEDN